MRFGTRTRPPADVRRLLRQEVGFGCPVPGCRSPFLSFHHFDPPWRDGMSHSPSGMIALCTKHHTMADGGTWSISELRALKAGPHSASDVRDHLPWAETSVLAHAGTMFFAEGSELLRVAQRPLLALSRDENRCLGLSLALFDAIGRPIIRVHEGTIELFDSDWHDVDISTSSTHVKIWHKPRSVGLDLRFRRVRRSDLRDWLLELGHACGVNESSDVVRNVMQYAKGEEIPLVDIARFKSESFGTSIDLSDAGARIAGIEMQLGWVHGPGSGINVKPDDEMRFFRPKTEMPISARRRRG